MYCYCDWRWQLCVMSTERTWPVTSTCWHRWTVTSGSQFRSLPVSTWSVKWPIGSSLLSTSLEVRSALWSVVSTLKPTENQYYGNENSTWWVKINKKIVDSCLRCCTVTITYLAVCEAVSHHYVIGVVNCVTNSLWRVLHYLLPAKCDSIFIDRLQSPKTFPLLHAWTTRNRNSFLPFVLISIQ